VTADGHHRGVGRGKKNRCGEMEETQPQPAFALIEVDSGEAKDEREKEKNGVNTRAFLQNPHVESAGVLPSKIIEISVARQKHCDLRVQEKENHPSMCGAVGMLDALNFPGCWRRAYRGSDYALRCVTKATRGKGSSRF